MRPYLKYFILIWGLVSCTKEEPLIVEPAFNVLVVNDDYSVPVSLIISNKTKGAHNYQWNFEGGQPAASNKKNPGEIRYYSPGVYTIKLHASNSDGSEGTEEFTIKIDEEVLAGFDFEIIESNYPPVEVVLTNLTEGATAFKWTFENGVPGSSNEQNPGNVIFSVPGEHLITLEVNNGLETHTVEKQVTVLDNLSVDFDWEVAFEDDDYQVPVKLVMVNNTVSATSYEWSFNDAVPVSSSGLTPEITINNVGKHTITLTATNGKEVQSLSKEIEVFENTNIRIFEDVKLGINTAHHNNTVGSFFSTQTRQVYTSEQVNEETGALIDLVFFGLSNNFNLNMFVSPNNVEANTTFPSIPNAGNTKFINSLETCNCGINMTVDEFDIMTNDIPLQSLEIEETQGGLLQFDDTIVPRIVLFENHTGLKGAVKIKEYVNDGQDSYVIVDIKVQKEVTE